MAKTIIDTNEVVVYRVIMYANSLLIVSAHRVRTVIHPDHHYQGTIYRNAQLRYKQIVYCTLWEECKQTQCPHRSWKERTKALRWFYSPTKNKSKYQVRPNTYDFRLSGQYGKYNINIFLFHPLGPFLSKMLHYPWILCFDLLPLQYTYWRIRYGGSWSIYFLITTF